ncbi:MAG TPA: hypothetical protein VFE01_00070, partial [Terracidiphilus sp.]|nr:hypothetical protein [Terracidiphilus sp.]
MPKPIRASCRAATPELSETGRRRSLIRAINSAASPLVGWSTVVLWAAEFRLVEGRSGWLGIRSEVEAPGPTASSFRSAHEAFHAWAGPSPGAPAA